MQRIAVQLGYGVQSVRQWVKQADVDAGEKAGLSSEDRQRMREFDDDDWDD